MPVTAPDTVEVYLLVEQPRQRVGHWSQALAALDSPDRPALATVHAHYDPSSDQAVLELRYARSVLGESGVKFVIDIALSAEVGMVQPAELDEASRARFIGERLARCKLQALYQRSVVGALVELARRIKDTRRPGAQPPPVPKLAKGTRDDLQSQASSLSGRHVIARTATRETMQMEPLRAQALVSEMKQRAGTVPPNDKITRPHPVLRPDDVVGSTPYLPPHVAPDGGTIHARYLRSGRWIPIRVGALSLKGAALLTGALPRLADHVDIALAYGSCRALVRGHVSKVSTEREAAYTGAATFSVTFDLDPPARRQLTALLQAARAAKVTIKPPPARATRRFPVDWPITLGTPKGPVKVNALDVSVSGLFVTSPVPLQVGSTASIAMVLDDGQPPIAGRAKVRRHIGETLATQCGLAPGFGLEMLDMHETDRTRWLGFLARIERRAEKRVLVGASPERLAELQEGLAACGYAVVGGTDPGALVQLARAEDRPADAALIDAGWLQNGSASSWVENLFSARNVPFVTLQGDAKRARQAIDRLLDVVA